MQLGSMATSDQSSTKALPAGTATPSAAGATATIADSGFPAAVRLAVAAPPSAAPSPRTAAPMTCTTDAAGVAILNAAMPLQPNPAGTEFRQPPPLPEPALLPPATVNDAMFPAREAEAAAPENLSQTPAPTRSAPALPVALPLAATNNTAATRLPPPLDRLTTAPANPSALDQPALVTNLPVTAALPTATNAPSPDSKPGVKPGPASDKDAPRVDENSPIPDAPGIVLVALAAAAPLFMPDAAVAESRSDAALTQRGTALVAGNPLTMPSPAVVAAVAAPNKPLAEAGATGAPDDATTLPAAPASALPPAMAGRPASSMVNRPRPAPEPAQPAVMAAVGTGPAPVRPPAPPTLPPENVVAAAVSPASQPPSLAATPASTLQARTEAVETVAPLFGPPPASVAPADPAPLPPPVRLATAPTALAHDLGLAIARQIAADGNTLHVSIDPAELGRIDVRMAFDDKGILRAVVGADSALSLDLLRRDSADLGRAMTDAGVRADSQSFRFEGRSDGRGDDSGHNRSARPPAPADVSDPTTETPDPTRFRSLRWRGQVDVLA